MDSFTKELVSNASGELFPDNTHSSFTNFLPEQVNLAGQWEVAISEISYPSMYQTITDGKFKFFDKKLAKATSTYSSGLYTSNTDIVETMNTPIQERNNHNETCKTVKVSRRTQKVVICLQTTALVLHTVAPTCCWRHCWRHKSSLATMLSLYLKAKGRRHYNNWTVHELSDIQ